MPNDKAADDDKPEQADDSNPSKVQDLAKAGRDDFDPNEEQE